MDIATENCGVLESKRVAVLRLPDTVGHMVPPTSPVGNRIEKQKEKRPTSHGNKKGEALKTAQGGVVNKLPP